MNTIIMKKWNISFMNKNTMGVERVYDEHTRDETECRGRRLPLARVSWRGM